MNYKKYLSSLKPFLIFVGLIFIAAIIMGYFSAQSAPEKAQLLLEQLGDKLGPLAVLSPFAQFIAIFLNNVLSIVLTLGLGIIFGILPLIMVFSNGLLLGILAFFAKNHMSWKTFFGGLLPHGILEIPLVLLTAAVGVKLGSLLIDKIFRRQKNDIKTETRLAFTFLLRIILPLLLVAAAIETFITPYFISS